MKEVLVRDLKAGDIFYYNDSYRVVLPDTRVTIYDSCAFINTKCIMAPTPTEEEVREGTWADIGTEVHIATYVKVKLLVRDGKEV